MNASNGNWIVDEFGERESPLETATRIILAEPIPSDACRRVHERAVRLAATPPAGPHVDPGGRRQGMRHWPAFKWGTVAVAAAFAVFVSMFPFSASAILALDELVDAVRRQPWIHATTTLSNDQQARTVEMWVSPEKQFAAVKSENNVQFDDFIQGISLKYDANEGNVHRIESSEGSSRERLFERMSVPGILSRLIDQSITSHELFPGERVIETKRREETQKGKKSIEYMVHLQRTDNPASRRTLRIRVDGGTGLPDLWEERHSDGKRDVTVVTRFDYPGTGPGDIYALGVPRTVQVIDRVPRDELARIVAAHRAGRKRFDDYDSVVVRRTVGARVNYLNLMNLDVKRVRRKGNRYRIDQLLFAQPQLAAPPEDAVMRQWWKDHRYEYWSVPMQICDGKQVYTYRMVDDRITTLDKPPNLSVTLFSQRPIRPPVEDLSVDWPELMPEVCIRPHLWTADATRKFDVDPNAGDGPGGTLRIVVTKSSGKAAGEIGRFWLDPTRDYVMCKGIDSIAGTEEYDELIQSPGGQWFPQRVRCQTIDDPNPHVSERRYYVEFTTRLLDELFVPPAEK